MSEATPEATPAQESEPQAPTVDLPQPADDAPESEWKQYAKQWEKRARENFETAARAAYSKNDAKMRELQDKAKRFDELEKANLTELEKAQKAAEANEARAKAATERAVKAEVKSLADGFQDKTDAVLRLGDLSRFISDDGEIDDKAIAKELAEILKNNEHLAKRDPKPEPAKPGQRPTETLRPGAAPAEPERANNLFDAVGAWANQT